ncbi:MAG: hypothetical protein Q8P54_00545 [bacterium]|nr:hypothetical protein [bacterium]
MKKIIFKISRAVTAASVLFATKVYAATEAETGAGSAAPTGAPTSLLDQVKTITNTLLLIVGIAAVIMLIIGGLRYIFSGGDKEAIDSAKNTILYAVIGIVVALLAFAIVNFVLGRFGG